MFTSVNKCFLITDNGIYEPKEAKRLYYENAFGNGPIGYYNSVSWKPSSVFIDKYNNIWLGFSAGEWGGDIIIFSTDGLRFVKFKERQKDYCLIRPVRSFFQIDSTMYAVTSLQHMSSISSSIIEITDTCRYFFQSPIYKSNSVDDAVNLYKKQEVYMGPAIFNNIDSSIFFYCQFGVFKGHIKKDLNKLENWSLILKPKFMWYYGMPDAVGYGINVKKMLFEKEKLFILSPENGILIWDGKQSVLLKTTYSPED